MSTRPPRNFFVETFRREVGMLSRVADSLYWMGRYIERAEHTARLVSVELQLWLDQSPEMGAGRWRFLRVLAGKRRWVAIVLRSEERGQSHGYAGSSALVVTHQSERSAQ